MGISSSSPALGFSSLALSSHHSPGPALDLLSTDIFSPHRQGWFYFSSSLDFVWLYRSQRIYAGAHLEKSILLLRQPLTFWRMYVQSKWTILFNQITHRLKFMSPDHFFCGFEDYLPWVRLNLHPNLIFNLLIHALWNCNRSQNTFPGIPLISMVSKSVSQKLHGWDKKSESVWPTQQAFCFGGNVISLGCQQKLQVTSGYFILRGFKVNRIIVSEKLDGHMY